jgi:uracil-DNA glycosylase family 4
MDKARLTSLVLQQAETIRLLGADCIPIYRIEDGTPPALEEPEPLPEPIAAAAAAPAAPTAKPPARVAAAQPAKPNARPSTLVLPTCTASAAVARSRVKAQAAMDALRARYEADAPHEQFVTAHHNIVWGEGDIRARLMFVGEAPGEEEDKTGRPFVGRAGELLNKMITAMGLKREEVYIGNVLKTRPPNNATPTTAEAQLCAPYLYEQIAIIGPEVIVTLGLPATRLLLNTEATMSSLRGQWASFTLADGRAVPVMPTYHPAYVLRSYTEEVRGKVWSDLRMAMEKLGITLPEKRPGA